MSELFSVVDLAGYLHAQVDASQAAVTERVVFGWIKGATGLTERPNLVPEDLWAWAVELGALQYSNPEALKSTIADGNTGSTWAADRRDAILASVKHAYGGGSGRPQGAFPAAEPWPDPVRRTFVSGW